MTVPVGHMSDPEDDTADRGVRLVGRAAQALELTRLRLTLAGLMFVMAFVAVGCRLVDVTLLGHGLEPGRIAAAPPTPVTTRADIVDRRGELLAASLPVASLYADPSRVPEPERAADRLLEVLPGLDRDALIRDLSSERRFVWLKRRLTPREQYAVNRLGIPGLAFQSEQRRLYPAGELTAHVLGFTDMDNIGIAGIERRFDERLRRHGSPLALSLDVRLQQLLHDELAAAIEEFRAIGGAGLILHARTGELLALVSLPSFNPYEPMASAAQGRFNRATLGVYEMGSTFKIMSTAMALDSGAADLSDAFDAREPIRVGRFVINDHHPENRWLTVPEIFMHSSNIGSVRLIEEVGTAGQQAYLGRLGLLTPSPVELPEVGQPMVPSPWREINTKTIAFGHGLAVTPLQLSSAVGATVNGGMLVPPTILKRDVAGSASADRVLLGETSDSMRRLLRLAVLHGTGRHADADGYLVGGKTGTAEKAAGRRYDRSARLSSFVAAFPIHSPEFVVFAMLDEPKGTDATHGFATGGWVAAPVVRRVIERMGPMLGIPAVDGNDPAIRAALDLEVVPRDPGLLSVAAR